MGMLSRRLAHKNKFEKNKFSSNTLRLHENGKIFTLNYRWIFGTVVSTLVGLFTMYISMHYLTAFVSPQHFLLLTPSNYAANQLEDGSTSTIQNVIDSFSRDRAYIRGGKGLTAHYIMPEGKTVELEITRCQPVLIVEVFWCSVASTQTIKTR